MLHCTYLHRHVCHDVPDTLPSWTVFHTAWYRCPADGYDYVCADNSSYVSLGRTPQHDGRCLLRRGGPCGASCTDGGACSARADTGPTACGDGSACVSNCTRQIGYGESLDLRDALLSSTDDANFDPAAGPWTVSDDHMSTFFEYKSPTDGRRHQVWVDQPQALRAKVRAIVAAVPGLRGTGMWTANAFHRRDPGLAAKTAAVMFGTLA